MFDDVKNIISKYEADGLKLTNTTGGKYKVTLAADATSASETIKNFTNDIRELKKEYQDDTSARNNLIFSDIDVQAEEAFKKTRVFLMSGKQYTNNPYWMKLHWIHLCLKR